MHTFAYGPHPDQVGDLYVAAAANAPLVCLLHGGFWRMPYGRDQLDALASALAVTGCAVWNIGYRRVGPGGTPWPATLEDVRAALAAPPDLQRRVQALALSRVVLLGHSAGGHLAFYAAARARQSGLPHGVAAVIGLAPMLDLDAAHRQDLGPNAVANFLGGSPEAVPERYRDASPIDQLPLGVPQWILHGAEDTVVPPGMSRSYAEAARAAGDSVTHDELHGMDHMGLIDPTSAAFPLIRRYLSAA